MNKECIVDMKYNTFCWSDIDYSIIKGKAKDELKILNKLYGCAKSGEVIGQGRFWLLL